jgi:putative sigma-54 modulation protein
MRVEITARSIELTDNMKERMERRLMKLKKFFNGVLDCHVFVNLERFIYKFEITLHGNGFDLFAEAHDEDLHVAFESAADKIERQVRKLKDKIKSRRGRKPEVAFPESAEAEDIGDYTEELEGA